MRMSQQDLPNKSGHVIIRCQLRIVTGFPQISCKTCDNRKCPTTEFFLYGSDQFKKYHCGEKIAKLILFNFESIFAC